MARPTPSQRGQALVEFALVMPLVAVLLVGGISVSKAAYDAMIVQEAVVEAGKMASIDRLDKGGTHANQMTDGELRDWIKASVGVADTSITPDSITCTSNPGNWKFNGGEKAPGAPAKQDNVYGSLLKFASNDLLDTFLNPSLGTMRVTYRFNPGFIGGAGFPIEYVNHFNRYQMTWFPLAPKQGDDSC